MSCHPGETSWPSPGHAHEIQVDFLTIVGAEGTREG
jgi:hypothetical protein